ncbi:hydroxyisourate hydrolase [Psychrobacter alimentarius]|uniref:hydroxyisourate hydrolase n=1 Tax=Psychrobacter alimentarius TaxID=261164 RepID=UPI001918B480|nr:hydroxyisourate hydrolase [Psychrobacter alimentarius]
MRKQTLLSIALGSTIAIATPALADLDKNAYQLSSHVLDISTGKPAPNINIKLMVQDNGNWKLLDTKTTDEGGRVNDFLPNNSDHDGVYKLIFETTPYFSKQGVDSFYPYVEVNFKINDDNHYHVPITLSPYGYSTYKGS